MSDVPLVKVVVPIKTVSGNRASTEHWRARWARARRQKEHVRVALFATDMRRIKIRLLASEGPIHVRLVRQSPRKLDSDNLAGSQKHVRDAVAEFVGIDDGDESRLTFSYDQEKANDYSVRIEFFRR